MRSQSIFNKTDISESVVNNLHKDTRDIKNNANNVHRKSFGVQDNNNNYIFL